MGAAAYGYLDVVKFLVGKGADVNAKTMIGTTPMKLAERYKDEVMVEFLKQHGAKE